MTSEVPQMLLVMLSDEQAAGRVCVELTAFVRFHQDISRQLKELESRQARAVPQLALRGYLGKRKAK